MARVIVIGGHGKVALLLHPLLAARGDAVTAVIRNPAHAESVQAAGAHALVADVEKLETAELAELIRGQDAVVWSAGAGGGDPARTYAVDRDAAIRSIDAAAQAGVPRYIMVSYLGAGPHHGVPSDNSFFPYAEAKSAADAHLRESGLEWTVLGPGRLTLDAPTGAIEAADGPGATVHGSEVPRGDVAAVIAEALHQPGTARRTIDFVGGDTPIAEALAAR